MSGHRPDGSIERTRMFAIRDVCKVALVRNHVQETHLASILTKLQRNHNWAQLSTATQTKHVLQCSLYLAEQRRFNRIGTQKWRGKRQAENQATRAVVLKLFLIAYHLCDPYCHHVPPCSRKSQCAKYNSIKSLEKQK